MTHTEPYLSVVATSRNDDHGQSLLRRMQTFVNALIGQCKRHGLCAELIIVEWNPPADRPRFIDALRWPEKTDPCQVRIIEVPPGLHQRLRHSENLPLFQMIAKNVGIRRARGRFILATNIDILLSDDLMRVLARGQLQRGRMYRIDRHDVMTDVPVFADVPDQLRYCETHLLRINCREGTFELTPDGRRTVAAEDIAAADMGVSFEKGWYPVERWHGEVYRWVGEDAVLGLSVPRGPAQALCLEIEPGPGVRNSPFELQVRDSRGQMVACGLVECRQRIYLTMPLPAGQFIRLQFHTVDGGRPISFDPRILNFRVLRCCCADAPAAPIFGETHANVLHFRTEDAYILATEDIATPESGLRFGRGWHAFERWNGEIFRWVGNDAALAITLPSSDQPVLSLEVEPGPGVDNHPFGLQVRDAAGRTVARGFVEGRQVVYLTLPLTPGQLQYFQLHTEGGGKLLAGSTRVLNLRVLGCAWVDRSQILSTETPPGTFHFFPGEVFRLAKEDIAEAGMGLRFGRGWYQAECNHGVWSRWVGNDASIAIDSPPAELGQVLSMELQPGPGVDHRPFLLQVQDRAGRMVAQGVVVGREIAHLLLPLRPGHTEHFHLHVPEGGRRIPSDSRILNFNVLRSFWSKDWRTIAALPQPDDSYNFKTEDIYLLADKDIVTADMGLRFGRSWYPPEDDQGTPFRWAADDAGIVVDPRHEPTNILSLEMQPGPGVNHQPFTLQVQDRSGRIVAQGMVGGRERVHLLLPLRSGQTEYFRLRVPGGGRHIPGDARVLNFSVVRGFWSNDWEAIQALPQAKDAHHFKAEEVYTLSAEDVASPEMGLRFGHGWHPVERANGTPYRWAADVAGLAIDARDGLGWVLNLEMQPGPGVGQQPFLLCVNDGSGRTVAQGTVEGRKVVHLLLPLRPGQDGRFWLRVEGGGKRIATDTRIMNFQVSRCHWSQDWEAIPVLDQPANAVNFKAEDPYELEEADVAAAEMGLRFGKGWYAVERDHQRLYRWAGEDAAFAVATPAGSARALSLEVLPGPGVGHAPFTLQVLDAQGHIVAQGTVTDRKIVHLLLPLHDGQTERFRLHAQEGGRGIATDPRILNFAVFRCWWSEEWDALTDLSQPVDAFNLKTEDRHVMATEDIASGDMGLGFGPGWHAVERSQGVLWRWVGDDASLALDVPHGPGRALCLEVAPGPGVDYCPFILQVRDVNRKIIARAAVDSRKVIDLRLPVRPGRIERFVFHAEGGGRRVAVDPRIMNFAVFRCFWSREPRDAPTLAQPDRRLQRLQEIPIWGEDDLVFPDTERSEHGQAAAHNSNGESCHWNGEAPRRLNGFNRTVQELPARVEAPTVVPEDDIVPAETGLRFGEGWSVPEREGPEVYRWLENGAPFTVQEMSDVPVRTLSLDLEPGAGLAKRTLEVQVVGRDGRIMARASIFGRQTAHFMLRVRPGEVEQFQLRVCTGENPGLEESDGPALRVFRCRWSKPGTTNPEHEIVSPLPLHTCACGDFTLLAREDWFELMGYPEFEMFSLHIDSVFCYMAHHHGVVEEILEEPMRIYHIEHGTGSGWTPEGAAKLMERIAAKGISCLECQEVLAWATEMRRLGRPLVLNYEGWGMADEVLPETVVGEW